ncbi:alpha,alpha-trehalose phosphate synthase-like protein subunit [Corynespora cassiicola Philippines]|uniref:Alpha,alpha-trehalose phosphate synthase-like protein subunit n=1 Tax=Corynespora cassiicola Philippines TaxID=1448308 RepID=A0A2T2NJG1_CORCC|nr:alpha,alpha-trehalose phosphate synthase-like protein subunit [Corynespora cassiicola Philippines]
MTTFVVSLFLPYTVDFHEPKLVPQENPTPPPSNPAPRALSLGGRRNASVNAAPDERTESLLKGPMAALQRQVSALSLPKTPAAMEKHEEFFAPTQPTATSYFPTVEPTGLVRSDAHVPEWGTSALFNQPRSRADAVPPHTILEYAKAQERQQVAGSRPFSHRSHSSRRADPRWTTDWTLVPGVQGNGSLTNAVRSCVANGNLDEVAYVGLIGFPTDSLEDQKKSEICEKLEDQHQCLTVLVNDKDYDGHYAHYCKTILWPVFHYVVPDHPKSKAFMDHSWKHYVAVNKAFAEKVVKNYKRGDVIWIHDYHLLLVPGMIRQKLPDAQIGFYLHTAFPSSEVFRCIAFRKELLEGVLGANLVAFQTQEYAHHFLQTCSRILAVEAIEDGVQLENRFVNVWATPIGIDPDALSRERDREEVKTWIQTMEQRYRGKRVIVARDKLDTIRGMRQKLLGFELFLNQNPELKDKVVLIQVATSSTEDAELAGTISEIVTRIDASHSTLTHNPLVFLRQDIAFPQYMALLTIADALAITSLREGMNVTTHEFVICQDGRDSNKKHGPVILSEFTGSASIFDGAELSVNPWDYQNIANAFKQALMMTEDEKERRYKKMHDIVNHQTGDFWMRNLREHLARVYDEQFRRDNMSIPRLDVKHLIQAYETSWRRLFILDYEGTLAMYGSVNNTVLTNIEKVNAVLTELIAGEGNTVYVMSGRTIDELEMLFGRVAGLGLIAENGCFLRDPHAEEWTQFPNEEKTVQWKTAIKQILQYYVERVEGSWVEERHCSLIFHYENAEKDDSAARHAGDCANHINDASEQQRIKAVPTKNSVIIEPMDYDKSTAVQHIFDKYPETSRPEFLLIAGNDRDDETTFKWAKHIKEDWLVSNVQTVTVGDRNSLAMSTLTNGTTGLLSVLSKLSKVRVNS